MTILKKLANFWKKAWTVAHGFFQKMAPKSLKIFITFSDTYDVLMLCRKFELIPT